ncbi:cryptochrome/photolyase family protein [Halorubellus sp. PRR65]|uniref:cryptochrome/photolyase family protein n=1 Tax=Halorubellus sp. PRR65 TaxID=3098148 RepID=UPI002B25F75C|nr:cryptochrome/photolyase family protein [Halorubellus sp. PRR65]
MNVLVIGDQLTTRAGPLADATPGEDRVVLVESTGFARRKRYHPHKLVLVFAAMRHLRDRLRDRGFDVDYHRVDSFHAGFEAYCREHPDEDLATMRPASHGSGAALVETFADARDAVAGAETTTGGEPSARLLVRENETFLCSPDAFDDWAADEDGEVPESFRHEDFYRWMRERTGVLVDDGDPVGGEWNFDDENREFPRPEERFPAQPDHGVRDDPVVREVAEWVASEFETWPTVDDGATIVDGGETPGDGADLAPFRWPVTREGALAELDAFVRERLPAFGPYQDALIERSWHLNHSLLSPAVNLGLLSSRECVDAAVDAYRDDGAPEVAVASVEGFVRQLLGWREFVRHVYRHGMPAMADANHLDATEDLPELYWTGDTDMACLADAVGHVRERGYAHHIERLMLLSNFATTYGADPHELNRWFHLGFVDAYHWVTTPNVVGMGTFASPALSTKPYVSSANYVSKMSDHCANCAYDPDETTGEGACPFNALYWDFLAEHEDDLRSNHRMGLVYSHVDRKRENDDLSDVRERASELRDRGASGDL